MLSSFTTVLRLRVSRKSSENGDEERCDAPEQWQKLAWVILVELLSYHFPSHVRWIETQDLFFEHYKFEHFVEIGPSPTLTGMAVVR